MNDNEKINFCKGRIKETIARTSNNDTPIFYVPSNLTASFVTASQEMMEELFTHQIIPIVVANEDCLTQSSAGAAQMFFALTLLAETLSKISRQEPQKIIEQFAKAAEEMLSNMSRQEIVEHCRKYGLPLQD